MASDPILHIKDSYYFDVPRMFYRTHYDSAEQIADQVGPWAVRNDADYQSWEADRMIAKLSEMLPQTSALAEAKAAWLTWQHADHIRHGRPFDQYVEDSVKSFRVQADKWADKQTDSFRDNAQAWLAAEPNPQMDWKVKLLSETETAQKWREIRQEFDSRAVLDQYLESPRGGWDESKLGDYNHHLSGKVFIPQPFGELRNAYEKQSGFAISRYMIIEVIVAVGLLLIFRWLAGKVRDGQAPKGKVWNLLESFLTFIKTDVVEKGIDPHDSAKFMPLFWTLFMFILGCNLMGLLPWVGSPTASFALTVVLALVIFVVGTVLGVRSQGFVGYFKGLVPQLGLPIYLAIFIIPIVWVIEVASLLIKHVILSIRLLANMTAGHMVLLGIMGLAFGAQAVSMNAYAWSGLSVIALLGTTLLSFLELFVAFLQAYVFTLLAALFVGSATHSH